MSDKLKKLSAELKEAKTIILKDVNIIAKNLVLKFERTGAVAAGAIPAMMQQAYPMMTQAAMGRLQLQKALFKKPESDYIGDIKEVTFMRSGRGGQKISIGGQKSMNFYLFDAPMPHPTVVSADTFDLPIHTKERPSFLRLAKPVKQHFSC